MIPTADTARAVDLLKLGYRAVAMRIGRHCRYFIVTGDGSVLALLRRETFCDLREMDTREVQADGGPGSRRRRTVIGWDYSATVQH